MGRKIWLLNALLMAGVAFFAYQGYLYWSAKPLDRPLAVPAAEKQPRTGARSLPKVPPPPPRDRFQVIEEKNLFSQTRSAPQEPVAQASPAAVVEPPEQRYILYGVLRLGEAKYYALIKDKKTPNSKAMLMATGDSLGSGHTIKEISDRSVLVSGVAGDAQLSLRAPKGPEDTGFVARPVSAAPVQASKSSQYQKRTPGTPAAKVTRPAARTGTAAARRRPAPPTRKVQRRQAVEEDYDEDYYDEDYYDEDYYDEDYYDEDYYDEDYDYYE